MRIEKKSTMQKKEEQIKCCNIGLAWIYNYFDFPLHKTNLSTEILSGIGTYISLSYIFIVNPIILGYSGLNSSSVLFATVIASSFSTFLMGFWAKLPFAVAPGLEMNGYFSLVLCGSMELSWSEALTVVFCSGMLNIFFTMTNARETMINILPSGLKRSLATCIGVIVISIAFQIANLITYEKHDIISINTKQLSSSVTIIMLSGLLVALIFNRNKLKLPLNIFISLVVSFALCLFFGIKSNHIYNNSSEYFNAFFEFDFDSLFISSVSNPQVLASIIILFVIDFVGGAGKMIGLSPDTGKNESLYNLKKGLYVDGIGTVAGSCLGTSSLVAFVESRVGIEIGGRTGLTAIVCSFLMLLGFYFQPIISFIPPLASTGILLYIGYMLMPWNIDPEDRMSHTNFDKLVGVFMAITTFVTFGIDKAMAIGFFGYFIKNIRDEGYTEKTRCLAALSIILIVTSFVQHIELYK